MLPRLTLLLSLCCAALFATAQIELQPDSTRYNDCRQKLEEAKDAYHHGRIYEIPRLLESCLSFKDNGFTKEDALEALRLQVLAYSEIGDTVMSTIYFRRLLHMYPRYVPADEVDPLRLVELRRRYKVFPALSVGVYAGGALTSVFPVGYFTVLSGSHDTAAISFRTKPIDYRTLTNNISQRKEIGGKYQSQTGQHVGFQGVFAFSRQIHGVLSGELSSYSYGYQSSEYILPVDSADGTSNSFITWNYNFSQRLLLTSGRLGVEWQPGKISWLVQPTLYGGIGISRLLTASREMQRIVTRPSILYPDTSDIVRIDTHAQFYTTLFSWSAGAGVRVGRGNIALTTGLRLDGFIGNVIDPYSRYYNQQLIFQYYHADDDIYLANLSLNVGLLYHLGYRVVDVKKNIRNDLANEKSRNR